MIAVVKKSLKTMIHYKKNNLKFNRFNRFAKTLSNKINCLMYCSVADIINNNIN